VARLYVVSDVLHNSSASVRNASAYRTLLEAALPTVFESLRSALRGDGVGRIAAEQLKRRVLGVLRVWENWFLFPEAYLTGLQVRFFYLTQGKWEGCLHLTTFLATLIPATRGGTGFD
jgi:U2-associated protein SR140